MLFLQAARAWLAAINPGLPAAALVLVLWASQAAVRRYLPGAWAYMAKLGPKGQEARRLWQALPSLAGGALLGALTSGLDPWESVTAAVVGAATPLFHHLLKASPLPYQGELGEPKKTDSKKGPPSTGGAMVGLIIPAFILLGACTPAHWAAQREAAEVVASVANDRVLGILETAYRADGLMGIERARTADEAQLYLIEWKSRWLPVWAAWEVFKEADAAWVAAIDSEGDVLTTGEAVRAAFCLLRRHAHDARVHVPDFPLLGCAR